MRAKEGAEVEDTVEVMSERSRERRKQAEVLLLWQNEMKAFRMRGRPATMKKC